jgi:hypothetical protein
MTRAASQLVMPDMELLLPYDGVVTIDTTGVAKTLWDGRDRNYGEQPRRAEMIWLTADDTNNPAAMYLGSRYVIAPRGYGIPPGERFPPFGPINLEDWWVNGTAGDQMPFMYMAKKPQSQWAPGSRG